MATIAIGDIHGCLPPLEDLLSQLTGEVSERDTIVFLGDYIDRGPDTKGCIDRMLRFIDEIRAPVVCLCGNHAVLGSSLTFMAPRSSTSRSYSSCRP